ncbi:uncharacterized protein [Ptychodera flava]|uniref:uncharacterized protein isoform X2 n=1 Tax=Ptychodera flava TaxID=63121 RepID=UPI00396A6CF6
MKTFGIIAVVVGLSSIVGGMITIEEGSFRIIGPESFTISRTADTTITFTVTLMNSQEDEAAISVKLYLSDNEDLSATGATVSPAIDVNSAPTEVPGIERKGDGSAILTPEMTADIRIESAEECDAYNRLCLKVELDSDSVVDCINMTDNINCGGNGEGQGNGGENPTVRDPDEEGDSGATQGGLDPAIRDPDLGQTNGIALSLGTEPLLAIANTSGALLNESHAMVTASNSAAVFGLVATVFAMWCSI